MILTTNDVNNPVPIPHIIPDIALLYEYTKKETHIDIMPSINININIYITLLFIIPISISHSKYISLF